MITTIDPKKFRRQNPDYMANMRGPGCADDKMILVSLKGMCKTPSEATALIEKIFRDISNRKRLEQFEVAKEIRATGMGGALSDALILRPTFQGVGVDLPTLFKRLRPRIERLSKTVWRKTSQVS
jgi:hypothetical protein